jgi:hypothetical protein
VRQIPPGGYCVPHCLFPSPPPAWLSAAIDASRHRANLYFAMPSYAITLPEFESLCRSEPALLHALVSTWFPTFDTDTAPDILRDLHNNIQADPDKQYRLYQLAMTIWR